MLCKYVIYFKAVQILAVAIHRLCGLQPSLLMAQLWSRVAMTRHSAYGTAVSPKVDFQGKTRGPLV